MTILDAFKEDIAQNGGTKIEHLSQYNSDLQEEIIKQQKAIADYDTNPETLDSQIKFNDEEIPFDEKEISKQLYIDEDAQYPDADNPEELLKQTIENKDKDIIDIHTYLEPCECNEVKVGDKLKIYNKKTKKFDIVEVSTVCKLYNAFTLKPVVGVTVTYDYEGATGNTEHGERKLYDPQVYYKLGSDEPITEFTFKDENPGK